MSTVLPILPTNCFYLLNKWRKIFLAAAEVFTAPKPFRTAINQHESPESVPPTYSDFPDYQPSIPNQAPNLEPVGTDLEPIDTQELLHGFNLFDVELLNVGILLLVILLLIPIFDEILVGVILILNVLVVQ